MRTSSIPHRRLHAQGIARAPYASVDAAVRALVAVQAQELAASKWSLGLRAAGVTEADVDAGLTDGRILRTHVLRPTWHYVTAADIRWLLALTAPRVRTALASYDRRLGIDAAVLARSHAVLGRTLEDGRSLTRRELASRLAEAGIAGSGQWLGHVLMHAELDGLICSGPPRGRHHTYALLDARAPTHGPVPDREASLERLARAYFTSRGPATERDFRWWSGLTAGDARRAIELAAPWLERRTIAGLVYRLGATAPAVRPRRAVHLLQAYDEYMVAYSESRHVIEPAGRGSALPQGRTSFLHAIVQDGQVVGRWRQTVRAEGVTIETQWLVPHASVRRNDLLAAARRYGTFIGRPVTL